MPKGTLKNIVVDILTTYMLSLTGQIVWMNPYINNTPIYCPSRDRLFGCLFLMLLSSFFIFMFRASNFTLRASILLPASNPLPRSILTQILYLYRKQITTQFDITKRQAFSTTHIPLAWWTLYHITCRF